MILIKKNVFGYPQWTGNYEVCFRQILQRSHRIMIRVSTHIYLCYEKNTPKLFKLQKQSNPQHQVDHMLVLSL